MSKRCKIFNQEEIIQPLEISDAEFSDLSESGDIDYITFEPRILEGEMLGWEWCKTHFTYILYEYFNSGD